MSSFLKFVLLCIIAIANQAMAETFVVGPDQKYTNLYEAAKILQDGDVVEIVPGIYQDCAVFEVNNLIIRPQNWSERKQRVRFQNVSCNDQAIFLIYGDNIRIEGIEFANARVPDGNGAGVKFVGKHLSLKNTLFVNNEMGLLTAANPQSKIVIDQSTFEFNGREAPGWGHGVYVGKMHSLTISNSIFKYQKTGHHIKSRANYTEVTGCEILDGEQGTASYLIDVYNGGSDLIANNIMQKGTDSENVETAICIACEGNENNSTEIVVRDNLFTNESKAEAVFLRNLTQVEAQLDNNKFKGYPTTLLDTELTQEDTLQ